MLCDVEKVDKNCRVCHGHEKTKMLDHPAILLEINGIFDRIVIDLEFGLPVTKEGYVGILVITEYLTKYPFLRRSKRKKLLKLLK